MAILQAHTDNIRFLESLCNQDIHSEKFAHDLRSLLCSENNEQFSRSLPKTDLTALIELLDKAQGSKSVKADLDLQRKNLRQLSRICAKTIRLPSSHVMCHDVLKTKGEYALAGGAYADVFLGQSQNISVAIKLFRVHDETDIAELRKIFCKECVIWKSLSHPNVLPLLGVSELNSYPPFMLSPYMENGNLSKYLNKHHDRNRLELLTDVAMGLEYLHSRDLIHGDLKAANVVVDSNGRALLVDFGLASVKYGPFSTMYSIPEKSNGTHRWMSPEILDSDDCQPSKPADVYAFAMVAIEVFTGKVPFPEIRRHERVTTHVLQGHRPERPENNAGFGLTDEVWKIIEDCWFQDPLVRPEIAAVLGRLQKAAGRGL